MPPNPPAQPLGYRLARDASAEIEVKRSRFIGQVMRVFDPAEASAKLQAIRKEHWQARHHCSAMIVAGIERSNDDGEPAGTAGAPMLQVLRGHQLDGVLAVVTRYFGGTLLGTGGLIRAYGQAVSAAIEAAGIEPLIELVSAEITCPAADAGRVENQLRHQLAQLQLAKAPLAATYGERARFAIVLPHDRAQALADALAPLPIAFGEPYTGPQPT